MSVLALEPRTAYGRATLQVDLAAVTAHGLPRLASHRAQVWVRGARRPVVGRISMDMAAVDLGPDTTSVDGAATAGDTVTVFGPGEPTTADWARWAETLEHEIVTGLSARLQRRIAP